MGRWESVMLAGWLGLLVGCAPLAGQDNVERLRLTEPREGSPFTRALAQEYRELALFEADERGDRARAERFARKGLVAADGGLVLPDPVAGNDASATDGTALRSSRGRLMRVFAEGARRGQPTLAAQAQARLDCWIAEQGQPLPRDQAPGCRDQFHAALGQIEAVLQAEGGMLAPGAGPLDGVDAGLDAFVVFFPLGGAALNTAGRRIVEQSVVTAEKLGATGFTVYGYADRVGDRAANQALSRRRADAVRAELVRLGAQPETIRVVAVGEAGPTLSTADGVPEPANRRAEIAIR